VPVFLDANIPMYLIGSVHPHKASSAAILDRLVARRERLVTDAEVFQEIMHRYSAIRRSESIRPAFDLLEAVVEEVFPIELGVVQSAMSILLGHPGLSSRVALHAAVMKANGIERIVSFDSGFDSISGIRRISS
jgi:hypothetical protein